MPGEHRHWTNEQMLEQLYGLAEPERGCRECMARLEAMRARQTESAAAEVSEEFLRGQRQAIWTRIEDRGRASWLGWKAPVSVAALALAMAILVRVPFPAGPAQPAASAWAHLSDTEFFTEVAAVAETETAQAAMPVKAMFIEEDPELVSEMD
jgi:hypothetical protein